MAMAMKRILTYESAFVGLNTANLFEDEVTL
jgi:hypothetical protein